MPPETRPQQPVVDDVDDAPPVRPDDRPGPSLPRRQTGSSPQHLLTTLLGDYWLNEIDPLPSATLVDLLAEFEVGATSARATLNRLARRGVVRQTKVGRNSFYGLAPGMSDEFLIGAHGIVAFGRAEEEWDGQWTLALFALTEKQREQRYALYSHLRSLSFAPLYDGAWISARADQDQTHAVLQRLGLRDATVFRAVEAPLPDGRRPLDAWDLDKLAAVYQDFIAEHEPLRTWIRDGEPTAAEALLARTRLMDRWRTIPDADPRLPASLLPSTWPRREAFDLFAEAYDALAPLAATRVAELVERRAPDLARLVQPLTTDEMLRRGREALTRLAPSVRG